VRIADVERSAAQVGWHPSVGLAEGLKRTVEWYAEEARNIVKPIAKSSYEEPSRAWLSGHSHS